MLHLLDRWLPKMRLKRAGLSLLTESEGIAEVVP